MKDSIRTSVLKAIEAAQTLNTPEALQFIEDLALAIASCYAAGGKILVAGNGGSLCDAMHFAEELTGYFREKRKALPAIALSDPGHMSCVANDAGFDTVFSRAIEALGQEGDIFVALTTSGKSENLMQAVTTANAMGLKTVAFLGKGGGRLKGLSGLEWVVDGFSTSDRIQEAHMAAIHIIIEMVELKMFPAISMSAYAAASEN